MNGVRDGKDLWFGFSVDWTATDVTRTSASTKVESGNLKGNIVGTSNPMAFLNVAHESVIIHISVE